MKVINKAIAVAIWSDDYKALAKWYIDVLGLKVKQQAELPDDSFIAFDFVENWFWIGKHDKVSGKNKDPYRIMIEFYVESVSKCYKELKKRNVYIIAKPFQDPTDKKVYLIHLNTPLKHARHYLGFSEDIHGRVRQHRNGRGSTFMKAVAKEQIGGHVSRIWDGDRELERMLKDQHNTSRLCPTCIQEKIFESTLSVVVNPVTKEKRPLCREVRIQPSLWEE